MTARTDTRGGANRYRMSIKLVPYPTGIDYAIAKIQRFLYERLYVKWGTSGLTGDMLQVYGRTYRNSTTDGFAPQWYLQGKDYNSDLFYDDRIQALIWFGLNDPISINGERKLHRLSIYVFCNLDKVRPVAQPQRMDERVVNDLLELLHPEPFGFVTKEVQLQVDNVVNKYSGKKKDAVITDQQHQPKLCFRIDGELAIGIDDYGDCNPSVLPQNFTAMTGAIRVHIKDSPDPLAMQTLVNGVKIPLEYPSGATVVIPHLDGRYVFPNVVYNGNNLGEDQMSYNPATTTYTFANGSEFYDGDKMLITYNENN